MIVAWLLRNVPWLVHITLVSGDFDMTGSQTKENYKAHGALEQETILKMCVNFGIDITDYCFLAVQSKTNFAL